MKIIAKTVAVAAALAFAGLASAAPLKAGTYTATVNGHNAPMTVKVTVDAKGIVSIDSSENLETIGIGKVALAKVGDKIIKQQSTGIDNVTGATFSSFALKEAVNQCIKQAGGDPEAYAKKVESHPVQDRTLEADVVIIGGGGSGLASAISAWQAGAKKVIVLEKLGFLGGSTNASEGALNAVDPKRQGPQGIEDNYDKFFAQTMRGGHDIGDPALVDHLTRNSIGAVEWLESLGVKFKDHIGAATGSLWQRSHYTTTPSGNSYIRVFEKVIKDSNGAIEVLTDTPANAIIQENGRAVGVVGDNFGSKVTVKAKNGVVIATGGFGANIGLRQKVNTGVWKHVVLDEKIGCTNIQKAAQGDGLVLGEKAGADVIGLSDIQIHPCGTPGSGLMIDIRTSGRNRIFVNTDGERFVNEGAPRDTLANAIFNQKGGTYWIVVNKLRYPSRDGVDANGATIKNMVALGAVVEANTLDELAAKTMMDPAKLKASVEDYNAVVSGKAKDKLGFLANNKDDKLLTEGPWYACKKVPTVHHTMGGLRINTSSQVLKPSGEVIPGLYAVGEVTGGIHGSNRLGGNAIADIMTYGHLVGPHIMTGM